MEHKQVPCVWRMTYSQQQGLRNMSHTMYVAKFEQTIIHQHVHLRRESRSHATMHVLMRLYPIDKSLVCTVFVLLLSLRHIRIEIIHGSQNVF
jgi:hypothetical protein